MRKFFIVIPLLTVVLVGCGINNIVKPQTSGEYLATIEALFADTVGFVADAVEDGIISKDKGDEFLKQAVKARNYMNKAWDFYRAGLTDEAITKAQLAEDLLYEIGNSIREKEGGEPIWN